MRRVPGTPALFVADDLKALERRAGFVWADAALTHGDFDLLGNRIHTVEHGKQQGRGVHHCSR